MTWKDICLELRRQRLSQGLSLDKCAFDLHTTACNLSRIERGAYCPSLKYVCAYADYLGISVTLSTLFNFYYDNYEKKNS